MLTTIECRAATTEFGGCLWHNNHTGTRVAWCRSCGQCRTTTTVFLVGLFRRSYTETWRAFRTCSALAAGERKCTGDRAVVRWQTHCRDAVSYTHLDTIDNYILVQMDGKKMCIRDSISSEASSDLARNLPTGSDTSPRAADSCGIVGEVSPGKSLS